MEHNETEIITELPENARRPLEPGETYVPVVPDEIGIYEVTTRSVTMGLIFCAIFAMAAAFLALRVGQGIEAAIPISILAIGMAPLFARKTTLLENVIVQSIGANSSHVVSGAVFTIPALYMLAAEPGSGVMEPTILQVIIVSFLGGCVGILFLIPLRYHFMVELHGKLPWPEGTATTEILLTGERVGTQAKILAVAAGLGALYDGLVTSFHLMAEEISFRAVGLGGLLSRHFMTLKVLNNAAIVGIGYIVGIRYAAIICAGSFLSYFVFVPMVHAIGMYVPDVLAPGAVPIAQMTIDEVFKHYVRIIGIGGIAGAGILGILSSLPSMVRSIGANIVGMSHQDQRAKAEVPRVDRPLPGGFTTVGLIIFAISAFLFFSFGLGSGSSMLYAAVCTALAMLIAFLFAPVAARAIAIVGTNPVSGMTMLTLIITGFVLLKMGLSGGNGMFITMMVGGVVCTALAASGALASDLKVGHWIGATPARQLGLKFLGTLVAAIFCGIMMWVMAQADPGQGFGTSAEGDPDRDLRHPGPTAAVVPLQPRRAVVADPAHGGRTAAGLRPGNVPADGAQHPGPSRRHPVVDRRQEAKERLGHRRQGEDRPRDPHSLRADGGRRDHRRGRRDRQRDHQGHDRQHRSQGHGAPAVGSCLRGHPRRAHRDRHLDRAVRFRGGVLAASESNTTELGIRN